MLPMCSANKALWSGRTFGCRRPGLCSFGHELRLISSTLGSTFSRFSLEGHPSVEARRIDGCDRPMRSLNQKMPETQPPISGALNRLGLARSSSGGSSAFHGELRGTLGEAAGPSNSPKPPSLAPASRRWNTYPGIVVNLFGFPQVNHSEK